MKKILFVLLLAFSPLMAFADMSASVNAPDHCTVLDSGGGTHAYSGNYFGICALQTAIDNGSVTGASFSNAFPSLGLFVEAIGGVTADPSSQYWALYQNGDFASLGLSQLPVVAGDTLTLELHDFSENYLGSRLTLTVSSLVSSAPSAPAPTVSGSAFRHDPFDTEKALMYLWKIQQPDGSFGSALLDDWVAIGSSVGGFGDMRGKLSAYIAAHPLVSTVATENERHAMALEALGIDPRTGTAVDYIEAIVRAFDGTQVGDPALVNDDIFSIFPLMHAGFTAKDPVIASTTAFIISQQKSDGSWEDSVDLTAAAIQALTLSGSTEAAGAIRKAFSYLRGKQNDDASVGNSYSTSWVMQAITATGGSVSEWTRGVNSLDYYLATQQDHDGGIGTSTESTQKRIWATSYAIPADKRKTWDSLLSSFPKPEPALQAAVATSTEMATATSTATSTSILPVPTAGIQRKPKLAKAPAPKPIAQAAPKELSQPAPKTESQTAAVGASAGVVQGIWNAIVSFFARLF